MCGFAGFFTESRGSCEAKAILSKMVNALRHRGPDSEGVWCSDDGVVGLAHSRLAVVGSGRDGHQPMRSASGRFVLAYNGEIYNYSEIRNRLEKAGVAVLGRSDTAVLLAACEHWGIKKTLECAVGMFAFALWDDFDKCLTLARDRFGEKPLYYGYQGRDFLFGSTLTSLRMHPSWIGSIDRQALYEFVRYDYVPGPFSIYEGIKKLRPGSWLELRWQDGRLSEQHETYWSALSSIKYSKGSLYSGDFSSAVDDLEVCVETILRDQMRADVPLGAFLSGGVDSSAVVSLMQRVTSRPVKTFTIGFDETTYDESASAEAVASYLGTTHTTVKLSDSDVLDLIPKLPSIYDEPFADASQIPTTLVSQIARNEVTVALSGDGGDEVFGGYNRYVWGPRILSYGKFCPCLARSALAKSLELFTPSTWDSLLRYLPNSFKPRHIGEKLHKLAKILPAKNSKDLYDRTVRFWGDHIPVLGLANDYRRGSPSDAVWQLGWSFPELMMAADTLTYLPDDILVKIDRAGMSVGLETRAPFLDHRLFEFLWSLPAEYRISNGQSKKLLRHLLYRHVPKHLVERPKAGFALPIGQYLRG
ncbi:MAG: asparagine synthase (glutamine-hydrolyzing), partial [Opitutae bacterium]